MMVSVTYADADKAEVRREDILFDVYQIQKFVRTQELLCNQRTL